MVSKRAFSVDALRSSDHCRDPGPAQRYQATSPGTQERALRGPGVATPASGRPSGRLAADDPSSLAVTADATARHSAAGSMAVQPSDQESFIVTAQQLHDIRDFAQTVKGIAISMIELIDGIGRGQEANETPVRGVLPNISQQPSTPAETHMTPAPSRPAKVPRRRQMASVRAQAAAQITPTHPPVRAARGSLGGQPNYQMPTSATRGRDRRLQAEQATGSPSPIVLRGGHEYRGRSRTKKEQEAWWKDGVRSEETPKNSGSGSKV